MRCLDPLRDEPCARSEFRKRPVADRYPATRPDPPEQGEMWIMLLQMIPLADAIGQTDATRPLLRVGAHSRRRGLRRDAQPGTGIRIAGEPKWGRLLAKWTTCSLAPFARDEADRPLQIASKRRRERLWAGHQILQQLDQQSVGALEFAPGRDVVVGAAAGPSF